MLIPNFSYVSYAQSPKVISGSPGDTLSYTGTGTPNAQVSLEVSASIGVGTSYSGGMSFYSESMNGLNVPGGNSMSITVSPVDTLTVTGSFSDVPGISNSIPCGVDTNSHVGSYSRSVPAARYNIVVSGIANGSPGSVSMSVKASQPQTVGSDGKFTASISTSGLPATVYTLKQNGAVVAMIYLGVPAPATPTPTATPTPVPSASANATPIASQGPILSGHWTDIIGTPTKTITPTASVMPVANGSPASAMPTSPESSGTSPWILAILAISCGTIIGVVAAYLFIIKKK